MSSKMNIQRLALVFVAWSTLVAGRSAVAESDHSFGHDRPIHHPVVPLPVEFGFSQDHSSTALEGALRGKAAVIQAIGNFELSASQAAILREQARALERENRVQQTIALHAQQALWRQARELKRTEREAAAAAGKAKLAARSVSLYGQVYALSADELDRRTGQIGWPTVLKASRFQDHRIGLEELFRMHIGYGDTRPQVQNEIGRRIDLLSRALRREVQSMPRADYMAAQKFLKGLKYAAAGLVG
jgi:hypothetical protein